MEGYDESTYGDSIAEIYDELYADYDPSAVDLLQELAGQGRILELGIGTGRIAIGVINRIYCTCILNRYLYIFAITGILNF